MKHLLYRLLRFLGFERWTIVVEYSRLPADDFPAGTALRARKSFVRHALPWRRHWVVILRARRDHLVLHSVSVAVMGYDGGRPLLKVVPPHHVVPGEGVVITTGEYPRIDQLTEKLS